MRILHPRLGDEKTFYRFLLFPLTINGETRWLEKARYIKRYTSQGWQNVRFIN